VEPWLAGWVPLLVRLVCAHRDVAVLGWACAAV
jgi:hypothetical protein